MQLLRFFNSKLLLQTIVDAKKLHVNVKLHPTKVKETFTDVQKFHNMQYSHN